MPPSPATHGAAAAGEQGAGGRDCSPPPGSARHGGSTVGPRQEREAVGRSDGDEP